MYAGNCFPFTQRRHDADSGYYQMEFGVLLRWVLGYRQIGREPSNLTLSCLTYSLTRNTHEYVPIDVTVRVVVRVSNFGVGVGMDVSVLQF